MRLEGLGTLTPSQIYATAIGAGFPPNVATQMTAIALRESGGNPSATNLSSTEQSYGLWQINVQGNPTLMSQLGITDPNQLLDPTVNAQAAYLLYGGNPANLNTAWYINQPGYSQAYQQYLPVAQQAAQDYADSGGALPGTPDSTTLALALGIVAVGVLLS